MIQEESNKQKLMESFTMAEEQLTAMKADCTVLGEP